MSDIHEIVALDRLGQSPEALRLGVRCWMELQEKGMGDNRFPPFTSDHSALLAIVTNGQEKMLGGIMIYSVDSQLSRIWIDTSYVMPEFRGTGVYRAMWDAIVQIAAANHVATIESATSVKNAAMRAVAKKLHREERVISMVYEVQP